jgi:aminomethyltransferase
MGRFTVRGAKALDFLQHVLTNNAQAPDVGEAQYTMIPNVIGGAVDDAYLYRFFEDEYLLVVNAANRQKDLEHLRPFLHDFKGVELADRTEEVVMLSLQDPSRRIPRVIQSGRPQADRTS